MNRTKHRPNVLKDLLIGNEFFVDCPFRYEVRETTRVWLVPEFGASVVAFGVEKFLGSDRQLIQSLRSDEVLKHHITLFLENVLSSDRIGPCLKPSLSPVAESDSLR